MTATGFVMTVTGPIPTDELGVVLPHEHLISDMTSYFVPPVETDERSVAEGPVTMATLGLLRRNLFAIRDNLLLADVDAAIDDASEFRDLGGSTIVDATAPDGGRDPLALQTIARRTGLNVIMGCGHDIHPMHPPELDDEPVESIAERLIGEIEDGVGETGARPGIIGEIGAASTRQAATASSSSSPRAPSSGE